MKSIKLVSAALQKCKSCLPAFGKTTEQPRIIVHIPHSSTNIPKIFQQEFLPEKEKLHSELLCMTDWYTDELFACPGCLAVVHQFSRLVCDPERFLDPEDETMWQKGMGMYYTRMSDGGLLKRSPLTSWAGLQAYGKALKIYQQHHSRFRTAVQKQILNVRRYVLGQILFLLRTTCWLWLTNILRKQDWKWRLTRPLPEPWSLNLFTPCRTNGYRA